MTNLTYLERLGLLNLRDNDFGPNMSWADSVNDSRHPSLPEKSIPGVIASLNKKGLVQSYGRGRDAVIAVLQAGLDAVADEPDPRDR